MLSLVSHTLAIFKATLDSPVCSAKEQWVQVSETGYYLVKWPATHGSALVDKSTPAVVALYDTIPHGKKGRAERAEAKPSYLTSPMD